MSERAGWEPDLTSASEPPATTSSEDASVVRHEEELRPKTTTEQVGSIRVRKEVETYPVEQLVERHSEQVDPVGERVAAAEGDSGEVVTLEDGSVSIPVFEEEIVVTKRLVVRERVIIRKATVTDEHRIETELRKERVEVDADPGLDVSEGGGAPPPPPPSSGRPSDPEI